jgi:predicted esterase
VSDDATAVPPDATIAAHHVEVPRTARYYTAGAPAAARVVWVVLHGYGQLAGYFVRHFAPHTGPGSGRLVVAPEALSRFYVGRESGGGGGGPAGAPARVGATWMTREDRDAEIADYVRYLDLVLDAATAAARPESGTLPLGVLAFSQGAATACRWVAHRHRRGLAGPRALVLWGGALPHDVDLAGADGDALRALRLTLVVGDADEFATPAVVAQQEARLRDVGIPFETVRYAGGHRLEAEVLGQVLGQVQTR